MRVPPLFLAAIALLALPTPAAAWAATLETHVSLLVGFPSEDAGTAQGVLVVPGTVIPISTPAATPRKRTASGPPRAIGLVKPPGSDLDREEKASARLIGVAESLKETLRLARIDVSYRQGVELELDVGRELPAPVVASDVQLRLKLLGFNDRSASYEVQFFDRSTPIADTRVTVVRGQHAIVGGLDGEAAPYLFLVIEPRESGPGLTSPAGPLEGDLESPRVVEKVMPSYPPEAREARLQGVVIVTAVIAEDGSVGEVEVLKGLPMGLSESAVEAVKQWRFEPATLDGEPVAVYYNLTINFRLAKDKKE